MLEHNPFAPLGERPETASAGPERDDTFTPLPIPEGKQPPARHPTLGTPSGRWAYHDADGGLEGWVDRFDTPDGKTFLPLRYGRLKDREGFHRKGWGEGRPPYRLLELLAAPDAPVLVVEGEKAADAAAERLPEHAVITAMNGAMSPGKTNWSWLKGRQVTIWPDNDQPGSQFAQDVARLCQRAGAASVRIVVVPAGAPEGWDLGDELPAGWTPATIDDALAVAKPTASPEPEEPAGESDAEAVRRLARLSPLEYDRVREPEAEKLGVRVGTLDKLVAKVRGEAEAPAAGQGKPLELPDPDPWPEPVDGAALLDAIDGILGQHVVMPDEARVGVTLWSAHTYTLDQGDFAPRLVIKSPEKRCGKTTLLDALTEVCRRPLPASNISPAALFRTIEVARPTLLLDEADSFMRENEELRGLINSGHRRSLAYVIRTVEVGGEHEPRRFSTWAAMAIAGIGSQHGTIEDRSVIVELRRKLPSETVARYDPKARAALAVLARKLARWIQDHAEAIGRADPEVPQGLNDRAADNWRPLLAIAEVAGGHWPRKAREAATKLAGGTEAETLRVQLLADIREIARAKGLDATNEKARLASATICAELAKMEHRPWPEVSNGKPITTMKLAGLLKPFGIAPHSDGEFRGYRLTAFADAWARYLATEAPEGGVKPSSRQKPSNDAGFDPSASRQDISSADGLGNGQNPHQSSVSDGLTAWYPPSGGNGDDDDGGEDFEAMGCGR